MQPFYKSKALVCSSLSRMHAVQVFGWFSPNAPSCILPARPNGLKFTIARVVYMQLMDSIEFDQLATVSIRLSSTGRTWIILLGSSQYWSNYMLWTRYFAKSYWQRLELVASLNVSTAESAKLYLTSLVACVGAALVNFYFHYSFSLATAAFYFRTLRSFLYDYIRWPTL